jgi:hypothetical protein
MTFKNSNTPNSVGNRPKPKVEKIELSNEDKEDIKAIMEGKPSKDIIVVSISRHFILIYCHLYP